MKDTSILKEQIEYYDARASEYDQQLASAGRYSNSPAGDDLQALDIQDAQEALGEFKGGDVLELACGTGWWTGRLAPIARSVTALDASPEMIAINRRRLRAADVEYVTADLFNWQPSRRWDLVFFAFWLSHIPDEQFTPFWATVASALAPDGRVFFVDESSQSATIPHENWLTPDASTAQRTLADGHAYRIVKVYHDPAELKQRLANLGWDFAITCRHGQVFHGIGTRR